LQPFVGVHFSNELIDAMPVHVVRIRTEPSGKCEWVEKAVDWRNERFEFVEQPITDERIRKQLPTSSPLPDGAEIEINLAALDWIASVSQKLEAGYLLTIDYGYVEQDLAAPKHRAGTLQSRAQHRRLDSPFDCTGDCDITAHVNWTQLAKHGQEQGLQIEGFTDQHHFLTGILTAHPDLVASADAGSRRQLQTLLHPEMMGRTFQVVGLSREPAGSSSLSGFRFARPAAGELGLPGAISS
jgi:SAM-dependent MidA family methyltransferase